MVLAGCQCGTETIRTGDAGHPKTDGGPQPDGGEADAGLLPDGGVPPPLDSGFFYDGGCGPIDAGNPPYPRLCAPPTDNECDGTTDAWLAAHGVPVGRRNAAGGNGYDDDCDGLVDEGCPCTTFGQTKPCFLVPATQVDPSGLPLGWCATNSKGTVDCTGGGELAYWSGTCRGAQPPYPHDVCAPGDFNCDGLCCNPDNTGCSCPGQVVCPTTTMIEAPYPSPTAIQVIDGTQWIATAAQRAQATNWTWTVLGGDCDNVLPHPTFALYSSTNTTVSPSPRVGTRTPVKFDGTLSPPRYVASAGAPLISEQYAAGTAGQVYPAFALSGDYIVQGEFDLAGQHYVCTQKVGVRSPGIRAELCWDTVGGINGGGNDIDLHFARLQGAGCSDNGWDVTCNEDCYYNPASGCRDSSASPPGWGYADSAASACTGWGSERVIGSQGCTNPRLDLDNIYCDPTDPDPTHVGLGRFCGPENINLDNPKDGDKFAVMVNHYANHGGTSNAHPHVDIYCNGQRVISAGYNPATGQTSFPLLNTGGQDSSGDYWAAVTITAHVAGGQLTACDVAIVPSHHTDPTRDGPVAGGGVGPLCVESVNNASSPSFSYNTHEFAESGSAQGLSSGAIPATNPQWCKH